MRVLYHLYCDSVQQVQSLTRKGFLNAYRDSVVYCMHHTFPCKGIYSYATTTRREHICFQYNVFCVF